MQFSTIFAIFAGLTLDAARPMVPAALQARVEECSCSDAQGAYAVCLLERCGHDCTEEDFAPCVARNEAECITDWTTCPLPPA
ncbi:hypothetical protein BOTNAR_0138g00080 [Botryotinia narcissicola]|uniref:Extracellular membrane protein CFEM domain-containing protein n=1 Tax=Botryotinia narcissicola TaxID=278944 RepID=A0A4Z1IH28_9HELO|nr:hypothetical protein BOTNAR_0138g00080 [Botryotinia narcissicola]